MSRSTGRSAVLRDEEADPGGQHDSTDGDEQQHPPKIGEHAVHLAQRPCHLERQPVGERRRVDADLFSVNVGRGEERSALSSGNRHGLFADRELPHLVEGGHGFTVRRHDLGEPSGPAERRERNDELAGRPEARSTLCPLLERLGGLGNVVRAVHE